MNKRGEWDNGLHGILPCNHKQHCYQSKFGNVHSISQGYVSQMAMPSSKTYMFAESSLHPETFSGRIVLSSLLLGSIQWGMADYILLLSLSGNQRWVLYNIINVKIHCQTHVLFEPFFKFNGWL